MSQRRTWVIWMGVASSSLAGACFEGASPASSATLYAQPSMSRDAATPEGAESFTLFTDPATGFRSFEVHDADREIVYFDAEDGAMVSALSGDAVSGWTTLDNDLRWARSGVAFRVRFGTENGVRRAYFTETDNGTICNLTLSGPDSLGIRATSETPPNP